MLSVWLAIDVPYLLEQGVSANEIPTLFAYSAAIDNAYRSNIVSALCVAIDGGSTRIQKKAPAFHYRPFGNVVVDIYTAKVYTGEEAA